MKAALPPCCLTFSTPSRCCSRLPWSQDRVPRVFDEESGRSIGFARCLHEARTSTRIKLSGDEAGTLAAIEPCATTNSIGSPSSMKACSGGHGPCGGLRFSTPPTTSEMTHARVCIFPGRAAAGVGGRPGAAVCGRVDRSGPGAEGDSRPSASTGASSRSAVGAAAGAAGGDGRRLVLGGDRAVGRDRPAGRWAYVAHRRRRPPSAGCWPRSTSPRWRPR
jgi:hypothetical protein